MVAKLCLQTVESQRVKHQTGIASDGLLSVCQEALHALHAFIKDFL
jgi:hypothetical protein